MSDVSHRSQTGLLASRLTAVEDAIDALEGVVAGIAPDALTVTAFGAVGDGVTDCTAAFQAAVDYAYNNHAGVHPTIKVPAGRYKISASIQMRPHVRLVGVGEGTSHSDAGLNLGYGAEIVAAAGFDDYAFVYDHNSFTTAATDLYTIGDAEISNLSYRGAWTGRADVTVTTGGFIKFDGTYPIQGCRFENLLVANCAESAIYCNVCPLPGYFNNIWGRKIGGSVLEVYCGPRYGSSTARTTHFFRASNIQGDFIVGPLIKIDGSPVVSGGGSFAGCVFLFDGIKHEIDSDATGTVNPTTAFSKYCVHLIDLDRATAKVDSANVLVANPLGGGTPVTTDGAVLFITGTANKGPYWEVSNSRYGSSNAVADFLVWDESRSPTIKVTKRFRAASYVPHLRSMIAHGSTTVVSEVRVHSDDTNTPESYPRRETLANGMEKWGDGTAATDVSLTRTAANRLCTDDVFMARKLMARGQTALTAADFALSAGWGDGATITVSGTDTDQAGKITITANGSGIAARPTVVLTFADTTNHFWARAPIPVAHLAKTSTGDRTLRVSCDSSFSTLTMQLEGTPVAGSTYVINYMVMG